MAVSLYRNFRPASFDDVVGQDHIVRTLVNQIKTGNVSHAYIFTGTRGTGKTTTAKIFARAVNCLSPVNGSPCGKCAACEVTQSAESVDIIELDGASNNGVDEIRSLRDNSNFPPVYLKYKVYIIDEVHMLTINAFNALLKTLEEPPSHMIFILATTEIHKVPQTVLSRCMRFDFRLVPTDVIAMRLRKIFDELGVKYDAEAVYTLAKLGDGSVRDALSYADTALAYSGSYISYQNVTEALAVSSPEAYLPLAEAVLSGNVNAAITVSAKILDVTSNVNIARRELCNFFRNLIFLRAAGEGGCQGLTKELTQAMLPLSAKYEPKLLYRALEIFVKAENEMRYSGNPRIFLEAAIIRAADFSKETDETGLLIRLKNIENKLENFDGDIKKNLILKAEKDNFGGIETRVRNETRFRDDEGIVPYKSTEALQNNGGIETRETAKRDIPQPDCAETSEKNGRDIFGKMIGLFRSRKHFQLHASATNVPDAAVRENGLFVYFADEADFNVFMLADNFKDAETVLRTIEPTLSLKPVYRKPQEKDPAEETARLKELFNGIKTIIR
ncbi:MAG: DNA polymerase III subunit gamma/tau [Clostridiales bacterium]|jgi:DNA polymerase-3 subunit gamma/tau|nr:DNA polymerase III subunit gamma/tau [Clostridiales bacterium]